MAENEFKCPVCLENYNNPRMLLPCAHSLCEDPCMRRLLDQAGRVHCPVCRADIQVPSNGVNGFPKNFYLGSDTDIVSLIEKVTVGQTARDMFKVGDVKVYLYTGSIVADVQGIDAVTSTSNSDLDTSCGVARVIVEAAGNGVKKECTDYITKKGKLGVAEVFVSSPGRLRCKGIIHAVGPEWDGYSKETKTICAWDLYRTICKVLMSVYEKNWRTVALCAIGCGQGGVPKQLCAQMYMKAILDSRHTAARHLTEIHFVDIDSEILTLINTAHREWMVNNEVLDFKNAFQHV